MNEKLKKILLFICGAGLIVLGIMVLLVQEIIIYFCGFALLIYGVGSIISWTANRKTGTSTKWSLAGAIVACCAGVAIFIGGSFEIVTMTLIMVILGIWMIVAGILDIIGAVIYRKAMTTVELGVQAPGSTLSIVFGGIMVGFGLLMIIMPLWALHFTAIIIAIAMIVSGIRTIVSSFSVGAISSSTNEVSGKEATA